MEVALLAALEQVAGKCDRAREAHLRPLLYQTRLFLLLAARSQGLICQEVGGGRVGLNPTLRRYLLSLLLLVKVSVTISSIVLLLLVLLTLSSSLLSLAVFSLLLSLILLPLPGRLRARSPPHSWLGAGRRGPLVASENRPMKSHDYIYIYIYIYVHR